MKNLFLIAIMIFYYNNSFGQVINYVSFEIEITNLADPIYISSENKLIKKIDKNSSGIYKDTLNLAVGHYELFDGKNTIFFLLTEGFVLKLKMDASNIAKTIVFSGVGSEINNYSTQRYFAAKNYDYGSLFASDEITFKKSIVELKKADDELLEKYIVNEQSKLNIRKSLDKNYEMLANTYLKNKTKSDGNTKVDELKNSKLNKLIGCPSPTFNYENYKGGKTKLEDFRGKFVYIDVWATWCGPCRAEIPALKILEEKYHEKNIEFVSISIDVAKDIFKWRDLIANKNLGGVQLFADKDWNSEFMKSYGVTSIPRFILIDPNGKIVKSDAARPSNPVLKEELDKLLN